MHLSFFIMGYLAVSDMSDLKNRYQLSSYYYDTVIMNCIEGLNRNKIIPFIAKVNQLKS